MPSPGSEDHRHDLPTDQKQVFYFFMAHLSQLSGNYPEKTKNESRAENMTPGQFPAKAKKITNGGELRAARDQIRAACPLRKREITGQTCRPSCRQDRSRTNRAPIRAACPLRKREITGTSCRPSCRQDRSRTARTVRARKYRRGNSEAMPKAGTENAGGLEGEQSARLSARRKAGEPAPPAAYRPAGKRRGNELLPRQKGFTRARGPEGESLTPSIGEEAEAGNFQEGGTIHEKENLHKKCAEY